jgi:hypothetical protein
MDRMRAFRACWVLRSVREGMYVCWGLVLVWLEERKGDGRTYWEGWTGCCTHLAGFEKRLRVRGLKVWVLRMDLYFEVGIGDWGVLNHGGFWLWIKIQFQITGGSEWGFVVVGIFWIQEDVGDVD